MSYKWSCIYLLLLSALFKLFLELCFFLLWEKILEDQQGIFTTGNSMWNDVTVHSTYLSGTCQFWGFETYPLFFFIAELKYLKKIYLYFRERNF
jgi:hypothetical protein